MAKTQTRAEGAPLVIRGQKVLLDTQVAKLYGVPPKALIQAVKRNIRRFPEDFAFELTTKEVKSLGPQPAALGSATYRSRPFAFTEKGFIQVAMLADGPASAEVSVAVLRTFMELKKTFYSDPDNAPELTKEWGQRANLYRGTKLIRRGGAPKKIAS
jgi:hypothetical protein